MSVVDGLEPQIRGLLSEFPRMPATVIAERIGWPYSFGCTLDGLSGLGKAGTIASEKLSAGGASGAAVMAYLRWHPAARNVAAFGRSGTVSWASRGMLVVGGIATFANDYGSGKSIAASATDAALSKAEAWAGAEAGAEIGFAIGMLIGPGGALVGAALGAIMRRHRW